MKIMLGAIFLLVCLCLPLHAFGADGMVTVQSNYSVQESADRLEKLLQEKGMKIFARVHHSEAAKNVGVALRDTELLIFGNPKAGSPLMACAQSVAIDLPQKALVWQDAEKAVWISYNDPDYLVKRHAVSGCEKVIAKIKNVLDTTVHQACSR